MSQTMDSLIRKVPALCLALALLMASCTELADQLTNLPELKRSDLRFRLAQSSKIYDSDGGQITTLHETENRTIIPLRRMPRHLKQAVIAIEDERFFEHRGVDFRAVLRALLSNVTSGSIREGGSTITQQYVKNVIIAPGTTAERTLERKIIEAALSRQIERRLSKREILQRYLNTVYFGEGAYGVQEAALTFYGVPAAKLRLWQSAMLAGLIRSPDEYNPYQHPEVAKQRRNTVLTKMMELGWAGETPVRNGMSRKLRLQQIPANNHYPAPYFVDYVKRLITFDPRFKAIGRSVAQRTKRLFQGGLRIHTTVDLSMQAAAEDAARRILPFRADPHASVVAIAPRTGHVKAMVGGRDFFARRKRDPFSKLNLAIAAEPGLGCVHVKGKRRCQNRAPGTGRQAGSAFKIFALAAAIEEGIPLSKTYKAGSQIVFPGLDNGGPYLVRNYEGGNFGNKLSLLEATVNSVNVVYAQVMINDVGEEDVVEMAERMGIRTPLLPVPSAVLGANEVNPLDMASAFGTLATNGMHHSPVAVTRIVGPDGRVLYKDKSEGDQVLEAGAAYLATDALQQVMIRGTGTRAQIGRPAAGKTGTAQEYRDAWFVGYTPDLVASVWVGYPEGQIEMKPSCLGSSNACRATRTITSGGVTGGSFPAMIWQAFMSRAVAGTPTASFSVPNISLVTVTIDTRSGCLAGRLTPPQYRAPSQFASGAEPKKTCHVAGDGVKVPGVVGISIDEAKAILQRAGFSVSTRAEPTNSYRPGIVVGQTPDAGKRAAEGATVTLAVSTRDGSKSATVPNVLGFTRAAAESTIRNAGYKVAVIMEAESNKQSANKRRGRVWGQSPAGGKSARRGSTVTIWVNPR
ncbi:MAG: transglycosylase domain-containing protein [Actinomycetota bacterium]